MQFRHLIPSTLFGPQFDREDSHFIFDLIKKIVAGKGRDPVRFGAQAADPRADLHRRRHQADQPGDGTLPERFAEPGQRPGHTSGNMPR